MCIPTPDMISNMHAGESVVTHDDLNLKLGHLSSSGSIRSRQSNVLSANPLLNSISKHVSNTLVLHFAPFL